MNKVNEHIYTDDFEVKLIKGITFSARSTLIKLSNNKALIISPGPQTATAIKDHIQTDEVFVMAPNLFHHIFLKKIVATLPQSHLYGPSQLSKKQPWLEPIIKTSSDLKQNIGEEIELVTIGGCPILDETCVFHKNSKTLIVTDLLFNMTEPMPLTRRWTLKLVGTYNKAAQSKLVSKNIKDKDRFNESIRNLIALKPTTLIMAHGTIIEGEQICTTLLESLVTR